MFCVILQNKLNVNNVYFQYTAELGCSIKRNCLYVDLRVIEQNELNFPFDNNHSPQDIRQVSNWSIQI